ncbi:MAG TPA: tRNA pseudouridine(55) synthase TruB [Trebonia sp.]
MTAPSGLVIVDKPAGMTSHDVVGRIRRLAGTRRVGHAGTLDPMATGVLVIGVEKATRLLGYLSLTEKEYAATIRLGQSTSTDDAEGEPIGGASAAGVSPALLAQVGTLPPGTLLSRGTSPDPHGPGPDGPELPAELRKAVAGLTGEILQVPPGVSAIKVGGQRAYKLTRAGAAPELAPRPVTVYEFRVTAVRPADSAGPSGAANDPPSTLRKTGGLLDVDAIVRCSSGTYIRALARDLGAELGTGGHLTALRRTSAGAYNLAQARTLEDLAERLVVTPLEDAAAAAFPRVDLSQDDARRLSHGARIPVPAAAALPGSAAAPPGSAAAPPGADASPSLGTVAGPGPVRAQKETPLAAFAPDGTLVALVTEDSGRLRPLAVFAG